MKKRSQRLQRARDLFTMSYRLVTKTADAHAAGIWTCLWLSESKLVTGGCDGAVNIWSFSDGPLEKIHSFNDSKLSIVSICANADKSKIATSSLDGYIRVYSVEEGAYGLDGTITCSPMEAWSLAWAANTPYILTGSHDGNIGIYNGEGDFTKVRTIERTGEFCYKVACSHDGKLVAVGAGDGAVAVYEVESGKTVQNFDGHAMPVRGLFFSADSQTLYTACDDAYIHAYSLADGVLVRGYSGHRGAVLCVAGNGSLVASGSADYTVRMWDSSGTSLECMHTFDKVHQDQIWDVAFSPSGTLVASVADDRTVAVYHCPLGEVAGAVKSAVDATS